MLGGEEAEDTFFERLNLRREKFLWRYWWSYSDELRALMGYDVLMQTARFAETNGAWQSGLDQQFRILDRLGFSKFNSEWDNMIAGKINFRGILSESIPSLGAAFKKEMAAETVRRVNITAIALKRFELAHGNYPTNLNLLVPKFISAVPRDPVDGQPLRYHSKTNGTFLLYSVGENGVDDGGNPALEKNVAGESFHWLNPHALDWVWPQPATTNEVQAYFAAQAKGR